MLSSIDSRNWALVQAHSAVVRILGDEKGSFAVEVSRRAGTEATNVWLPVQISSRSWVQPPSTALPHLRSDSRRNHTLRNCQTPAFLHRLVRSFYIAYMALP